eukprot:263891_1
MMNTPFAMTMRMFPSENLHHINVSEAPNSYEGKRCYIASECSARIKEQYDIADSLSQNEATRKQYHMMLSMDIIYRNREVQCVKWISDTMTAKTTIDTNYSPEEWSTHN